MLSRARNTGRLARRAISTAVVSAAVGAVTIAPVGVAPAHADAVYIPWSTVLPGWTDEYIPTSDNDCVAGRDNCLKQTLKELSRTFEDAAESCSHNAVFALAYLRITQTYGWSRDVPGYYQDVPFANHQDAVFARYYTDAYWNWRRGNRSAVPAAWLVAFDAAQDRRVSGTGDLLLGMNAHIMRDLPFVLAAVGLVAPDGSSRKPDYDKVEDFLARSTEPMLAEMAQRLDPVIDDANDPLGISYTALFQAISGMREYAWRNAEALVSAPTPEAREVVAANIESTSTAYAQSIRLLQAYTPPFTSTTARDTYCAAHHGDAAPMAYPFGTPQPYGY